MSDLRFLEALAQSQAHSEVQTLCERLGPGTVISIAREYIDRKERAASAEMAKWRDEARKAAGEPA